MGQPVSMLLFQLGVILIAAKIGGEICERFLKQPPVLGELVMGMIIGPFALGSLPILGIGPLFPFNPASGPLSSVSIELYDIAQIAIILLLFEAGLGTDFRQFFRFAGPAVGVASGGSVLSFFLAAIAAVIFGLAAGLSAPTALFIGAIIGPTSTGITARMLREVGKLGSPEGVTTLASDVIDDVMGILVLTVVLGLTTTGELNTGKLVISLVMAVSFWLVLVGVGLLTAKFISRVIVSFRVVGSAVALALALAFLSSGLAEQFGLATVIGAYSIGLALSDTELADTLLKPIDTLHHLFVPIFFVVMGMLVDFRSVGGIFVFAIVVTLLGILGKVIGCGLPALALGFTPIGAARIGFGMVPRGEISLIIAGVGLTAGLIAPEIFGVAVMAVIITTLITPTMLSFLYRRGGEGQHPAKVR